MVLLFLLYMKLPSTFYLTNKFLSNIYAIIKKTIIMIMIMIITVKITTTTIIIIIKEHVR